MFVSDIIIPARFLFTVAQLTGIIALLYDRDVHILKALPGQYAQDDWDSFDAEFGHALRSGMVFAGIEVLSITLIGSTLLLHRLNFVQMVGLGNGRILRSSWRSSRSSSSSRSSRERYLLFVGIGFFCAYIYCVGIGSLRPYTSAASWGCWSSR